ncbi:hypothetical protein Lal_00026236 [Lupinus albus]|nr:hypothetical protein Lal_00026236 [Lupinus albus]
MIVGDLTYVEFTLEFLSSLEAEIMQGSNCNVGRIVFRMRDIEFCLAPTEFSSIFCLPLGGACRPSK